MEIRLNRPLRRGINTLGFGTRLVIWVQGCSLGCAGCASRDTWDAAAGRSMRVDALADLIVAQSVGHDGLTITGGEPLEQAEAIGLLLRAVRSRLQGRRDFDVLCYTGLRREHLDNAQLRAIERADALMDGAYVERRPTELAYRGSANQRLHVLSELGRSRYDDVGSVRNGLQVVLAASGDVEWIGIPRRGELDEVAAVARTRGILLGGRSW